MLPERIDVRLIVETSFIDELKALYERPRQGFFTPHGSDDPVIRQLAEMRDIVFDLAAVQRQVDRDLSEYKLPPERKARSRYHNATLRYLARVFAQRIFIRLGAGAEPSPQLLIETLQTMKDEAKCPFYGCARQ